MEREKEARLAAKAGNGYSAMNAYLWSTGQIDDENSNVFCNRSLRLDEPESKVDDRALKRYREARARYSVVAWHQAKFPLSPITPVKFIELLVLAVAASSNGNAEGFILYDKFTL